MANFWDSAPVVSTAPAAADNSWYQAAPVVAQPTSMLSDIAQSALSGVRQGVEGLAGMAGDANQINGDVVSWLASKLGASPESAANAGAVARRISPFGYLPTTKDVQAVDNPVVGKPYQPQTTAGDYARTVGQFAPAALMPESGALVTRTANVVIPALASETAGQVTKGTELEPYARAAAAIAGGSVPSALGKVVTPFAISPARQGMVDALANEGVPLTASQKTGSKALGYAESELGGNKAQSLMDQQADAFTNAAMQKAGGSGLATPDNLQALNNQLGQRFEDISARNTLKADQKLGLDIGQTLNRYGQLLEPQQKGVIDNLASSIVQRISDNGGTMPGQEYQTIRSDLTRAVQGNRANPNLADAFRGLRNALDDNMARSMTPNDKVAWQQLRRQYANYKVLENAAAANGQNAAFGRISPAQLTMAAKTGRKGQFARGQGDFDQLARAGQAVMTPLPNSGTAARTAVRSLGLPVGSAGVGFAVGNIPGAIAGAAAPYLAGKALLSKPVQAYLGNQAVTNAVQPNLVRQMIMNALLSQSSQRLLAP